MNVLVTGGARGIGAGIVSELAKKGHSVAFCGRGEAEKCAERLAELRGAFPNGKFQYYQCDISKDEDRKRLLDSFIADFGSIDMLVNNAGVAPDVRGKADHGKQKRRVSLHREHRLRFRRLRQHQPRRILPFQSGRRNGDQALGGAACG